MPGSTRVQRLHRNRLHRPRAGSPTGSTGHRRDRLHRVHRHHRVGARRLRAIGTSATSSLSADSGSVSPAAAPTSGTVVAPPDTGADVLSSPARC